MCDVQAVFQPQILHKVASQHKKNKFTIKTIIKSPPNTLTVYLFESLAFSVVVRIQKVIVTCKYEQTNGQIHYFKLWCSEIIFFIGIKLSTKRNSIATKTRSNHHTTKHTLQLTNNLTERSVVPAQRHVHVFEVAQDLHNETARWHKHHVRETCVKRNQIYLSKLQHNTAQSTQISQQQKQTTADV